MLSLASSTVYSVRLPSPAPGPVAKKIDDTLPSRSEIDLLNKDDASKLFLRKFKKTVVV